MKILMKRCISEESCRKEVLNNNVEGVWNNVNNQLITSSRVVPATVSTSRGKSPEKSIEKSPGRNGTDIPIVESHKCAYCIPWKLLM